MATFVSLIDWTDFPDDETGTAYMLALSSLGNVRTTTLRAFEAEANGGIIGKIG